MVDTGIKKIKINKNLLPAPFGDDSSLYYDLRYRILSDDKNRTSHWSNLERLFIKTTIDEVGFNPANPITSSIPNSIVIDKSFHSIALNWTMPSLLIGDPTPEELSLQKEQGSILSFDIYIQWREGNTPGVGESQWTWLSTVAGSNYSMSYVDSNYDHVRLRVQKTTQNKEVLNVATYAVTDWHSV